MLGIGEIIVLGMVAVLLFGKRLPEVAKTLGKHYNQFRGVLTDIQREMSQATSNIEHSVRDTASSYLSYDEDEYDEPTAPQLEAPAEDD
ncbi:MAG: twin-arginine translocase TatA/TatE family subunit [Planctomycetota bacterium]